MPTKGKLGNLDIIIITTLNTPSKADEWIFITLNIGFNEQTII